MTDKFKIAVLGIGAVGGYIGGKLASHFSNSADIEIYFIARGENGKTILENGLKLITPENESIAHPSKKELTKADIVICCTKSYHLESSMDAIKDHVDDRTVFLPLLNGVDAVERIHKIFPSSVVLEGCIYLVARLIAPGIVEQYGKVHQLYFGSENCPVDKLKKIEAIFRSADIDATLLENIRKKCWEKFFFISTIATLSSYLDATIGAILANSLFKEKLLELMNELKIVAIAKNAGLPDDIINKTLDTMAGLPFDTTPSMHTDFKKRNNTELESLTGYVVRLGKEFNIDTPIYNEMYAALEIRNKE